MAITFTGTVKTFGTLGNDALTQNLFTIENGYKSSVNMNIRRLVFQDDCITVLTSVMPILKTSRATAISGGVVLEKTPFNTLLTSDANIIFRAQVDDAARITATPGNILWQQFVNRMHTAVEQQQGDDKNMLSYLVEKTGREFKLRPGEALLCQIVSSAIAANSILMHNYFLECVFEEDAISTFSISGTVTLSASPVTGARVFVLEMDDLDGTNVFMREIIITPAGGTWSSSIRTGKVGAAFVQYRDGGTYYTAPGSPYLS